MQEPTIEQIEDAVTSIAEDMNAQWFVNNTSFEAWQIGQRDSLLPIWFQIAAQNAMELDLIQDKAAFPFDVKKQSEAWFEHEAIVKKATPEAQFIGYSMAMLLVVDALYTAVAMVTDEADPNRDSTEEPVIDLTGVTELVEFEDDAAIAE